LWERHSVNDARLHFGLGLEKVADIEIRGPNGLNEKLKAVAADRLIILKEGSGIVPNVGSCFLNEIRLARKILLASLALRWETFSIAPAMYSAVVAYFGKSNFQTG
jgi:hypothetical protein